MDSPDGIAAASHETDFHFYSRRALEEGRAATQAACPVAAAAHRRMAAVYASLLVRDLPEDPGLDELIAQLD
jgi:hypothetical protein